MEEYRNTFKKVTRVDVLDDCSEIKPLIRELALLKRLNDLGSQLGQLPSEWDSVKNLQMEIDRLKKAGTLCSDADNKLSNFLIQLKLYSDDNQKMTRNMVLDEVIHFIDGLSKTDKCHEVFISSLIENIREMKSVTQQSTPCKINKRIFDSI